MIGNLVLEHERDADLFENDVDDEAALVAVAPAAAVDHDDRGTRAARVHQTADARQSLQNHGHEPREEQAREHAEMRHTNTVRLPRPSVRT